jgi:hypothetical protein
MGIHMSLGILVWGYTKHGDTHITVTPATDYPRAFVSFPRIAGSRNEIANHNAKQFILIRCKHSQRAARSFVRGLEIRLNKFANKPSTSCLRTACHKLSTSMEQAVNNL